MISTADQNEHGQARGIAAWWDRARRGCAAFPMSPASAAFLGSVILSVIALTYEISLNRDGMLYVETAGALLEEGLHGALEHFDWLFLPMLLAGISTAIGLGIESTGHLLCSLLLAGTCALMVRCSERIFPATGWAACIVVLGLPAFNTYRDHIIREFGLWFFAVLACALALRWARVPGRANAVWPAVALGAAAAFRVEAIVLLPALLYWQFRSAPQLAASRRVLMLSAVPACLVAVAAVLLATGVVSIEGRLAAYAHAANPLESAARFGASAERLAAAVLNQYSRDSAWYVLLAGLLAMIPVKFLSMMGVFVVPLVYALVRYPMREAVRRWGIFAGFFLTYVAVLAVFIADKFFVTGRYVSFLNLLAVPLTAAGLALMMERFRRARVALVTIGIVSMLANVVSLSPGKIQYENAGAWIQAQQMEHARIYVESRRVAYHAGFGYRYPAVDRDTAIIQARQGTFDFVVLEGAPPGPESFASWLDANGMELVVRFEGAGRDILVLRPRRAEPLG